MDLAVNSPTA